MLANTFPGELISRSEYARRRGWGPARVTILCKQGRISSWINCPSCSAVVNTRAVTCDCGQAIAGVVDSRAARIDPIIADAEIRARKNLRIGVREHGKSSAKSAEGGSLEVPLEVPGDLSYAQEKAAHQFYITRMARLEYEQRLGTLVDVEAVRREVFARAREARDALQNARARLVPLLAAESDPARIDSLLSQEFSRISETLSKNNDGSIQH